MKKLKLSSLKKKAWAVFSRYIRIRDAIELTGKPFKAKCCTCGTLLPIKELQAGHFLSSRCNSILFEEQGVHAQCVACNIYKHGNVEEYYPFMLKKYGEEVISILKGLKKTTKSFNRTDYEEMIDKWQNKIDKWLLN